MLLQPNPSFRGVPKMVVMHDGSACSLVPVMGSLHYPEFGENNDAIGIGLDGEWLVLTRVMPRTTVPIGGVADDASCESVRVVQGLRTLSCIAAIDKARLYRGVFVFGCGNDSMRGILHAGR